jgi:hypothetical protein
MLALRAKAGVFLQANKQHLSSSHELQAPSCLGPRQGAPRLVPNPLFAWKWIALADKAGLTEVAKACFDSCLSRDSQALLGACTEETLQGLSHAMLRHTILQQRS